jgi:Questin oxidase-like
MQVPSYGSLDDALEILAGSGIELKNGNSNHAPMVAEALCAMGRPEAVMPWIARYRERLMPRPAAGNTIRGEDWRRTLGERDRFTDWAAFLREELQEASWCEVLDCWATRLAPGFSGAATHGVIRVGHAARSLHAVQTPARLRELADALASWAVTYQELPSDHHAANDAMAPHQAIARAAVIPQHQRRNLGNITASLAMLDDFPEFASTIGLLDVSGDIDRLLAELTEVFALVYLANARDVRTTIVFIHGVTSLAALGNIIPQVSDGAARLMLRYAWQSACALYACFGSGTAMAENFEPCRAGEAGLSDHAVANGDEHVIKFTEACLRRHSIRPSPAYLAAIGRVLDMIPRR